MTCELATVVRVDPEQREREHAARSVQGMHDGARVVVRGLNVLGIDNAHAVRQQVPLLKHAAGMIPTEGGKHVSEVDGEHVLHAAARGHQVLKLDVCALARTDFPPKASKGGDDVLKRVTDQVIGRLLVQRTRPT